MKASDRQAVTVEAPTWRDQLTVALVTVAAITVAGDLIVSAMSYQHEYELARHNQQAPWVSSLFPFSIDGVLFVAGVALLWAAVYGVRGWSRLWQPRAVLAVGALATVAANLFSDRHFWWLGPAVSASAGVSLVLMSAVAFWLAGEQRKVARGGTGQPGAVTPQPPPPLTLAEALTLARAWLQDHGELYGEEALAGRFGVSRHQVRTALANGRGQDGPPGGPGAAVLAMNPAGAAPGVHDVHVAPAGPELQSPNGEAASHA